MDGLFSIFYRIHNHELFYHFFHAAAGIFSLEESIRARRIYVANGECVFSWDRVFEVNHLCENAGTRGLWYVCRCIVTYGNV